MLPKPRIINFPEIISPIESGSNSCGSGFSSGGHRCETDFTCLKGFSGGCIDGYAPFWSGKFIF